MAMNLGTETGSLMNHLMSRQTIGAPAPEVGMAATLLGWTDRHAATVVSVSKCGTEIAVRQDHAKVVKGTTYDGSAEYEYTPNLEAAWRHYRRTKTGGWQAVTFNEATRRWNKVESNGLILGRREEYRDPSF